jgi:hypothetical protein
MSKFTDFLTGLASGGAASVASITDSVGKGATDIIAAAKGQLTPEDQAKIDALKVQTSQAIATAMAGQTKAAQDFAIAYEGNATQVPKWVLIMRSIIRPAFTLFFFIILVSAVLVDFLAVLRTKEYAWNLLTSLPDAFWWIFGIVVAFWFGDRTVSSVLETWKTGQKK